jgi:hypothetical protein
MSRVPAPTALLGRLVQVIAPPIPRHLAVEQSDYRWFVELGARLRELPLR